MGRGANKTPTCACGGCKKCKDRAYSTRKRAGSQPVFVPQGRKRNQERAAKKKEREEAEAALAKKKKEEEMTKKNRKALNKVARSRRDCAFKHNRDLWGLPKAKVIASVYTRRKLHTYIPTDKDFKTYRNMSCGFIDDDDTDV